jgi:hypothetical protein
LKRYLFLLLVPLVPMLQVRVDERAARDRSAERGLYLTSAEQVRALTPGFASLMADLYWLKTVQYFGYQRAFVADPHYDQLRALIDITTGLDPRFELAYRYGAVFMSEMRPMGAGQPEQGIEILRNGMRHLPNSWRLRWDLGSFYFVFMQDPKRAAEVLIEAARLEDAPFWLESLAGKFLMGNDRQAARAIWQRQAETGEGMMKENAVFHLKIIEAQDRRDHVQAQVDRFREATGRAPHALAELLQAGYLRALPTDPENVPFDYNAEDARVRISRRSPLWRSQYE